ncbi:hypothetical protein HX109_10460 [Galbibacter sp. BG1]|uniref:multiheme c-type cytochrome n=1 Tax=Galbibacter sp. BG1 TaxID=1170699 RepID=UPI0015C0C69F|nr:multiheme c-type cytochrome [Galbibacter sp. BG1]QLE01957.1 hypothetical protein HX109_10460 [Galbibacter sp. BG1]
MGKNPRKNYFYWIASVLVIFLITFLKFRPDYVSGYTDIEPEIVSGKGLKFANSESCMECHKDIYNSFIETPHNYTSAKPEKELVKGSFRKGENEQLVNERLKLKLRYNGNQFYQETMLSEDDKIIDRKSIDMVIGSGTRGQSYLTWKADELYQLPISYFTPTNSWTLSPGIEYKSPSHLRPVNGRCLECHVTYAKTTSIYGFGNTYNKQQILYGVDCQRCHGPAAKHVSYHKNETSSNEAKFIVKIDTLSNNQKLDLCALCHAGKLSPKKEIFSYVVGENLEESYLEDPITATPKEADVHGNQLALLKSSKCFEKTEQMNCSSCHDPHRSQRGNFTYFNNKCISCHSQTKTLCAHIENNKTGNCVECHMPMQNSKSMLIQAGKDGAKIPVQIRTHLIAIYNSEKDSLRSLN